MKTLIVLIAMLFANLANSQCFYSTVSVNDGNYTETLTTGIDTSATDGLDSGLGEMELPPAPPAGAFDVRFIGSELGQGTHRDVRQGSHSTISKIHTLKWQRSTGSNSINLTFNLPSMVNVRLQDNITGTIVDTLLSSSNNTLTVTNTGLSELLLTYNFGLLRSDVNYDGIVDMSDINMVYNFIIQHPDEFDCRFDVNYDNYIDVSDLIIVYNDSQN